MADESNVVRIHLEEPLVYDLPATVHRAASCASVAASYGVALIAFRHHTWKEVDKKGEVVVGGRTGHAITLEFASTVQLSWFR